LTAIAGLLPLLIIPGSGAEIYRGLSAVIIGGLLVSHVFTVILMPALLRLGEKPAFAARHTPAESKTRPADAEAKVGA
jgi:Cu/Ag efflux pump CusA